MKRVHIYYSGRVQGVGFRFTAEDLAASLGITGWVKNLADGRVEITAEAREEVLQEFSSRLNEYFSRYITDAQMEYLPATGEFKDFSIHY